MNENEQDAKAIKDLQEKFIKSYIDKKGSTDLDVWLKEELQANLPEKDEKEIDAIADDILSTLKINEDNKQSLDKAVSNGISKEDWLASSIKKSTSHLQTQETAKMLNGLDEAVNEANIKMRDTLHTKLGNVNQNPNLDGFIAEQNHANTFNLDAKAKGSKYIAEVLVPKEGQTYVKNSVDIVIKDTTTGKIVQKYQSKYGKTAEDTIKLLKVGNYNNQRILVPEEQVEQVKKAFPNKTVEATVKISNVSSEVLAKETAKKLQTEAQSGNFDNLTSDWNDYKMKDLSIGIGKQVVGNALMACAIGAGIDVVAKLCKGEEIKGKEVVEKALKTGADVGIKTSVAAALKVGSEKGLIKLIPKGTPAGLLANIANIGIENVKILFKMTNGELTAKECLEKIEQTTVSCVAGIFASSAFANMGATIGTVLGPVGSAIGYVVGGCVGHMAGSQIGMSIMKAHQKVRDVAVDVVKNVGSAITSCVNNVVNRVANFFGL